MAKADVLSLVDTLSNFQADATLTSTIYDEVVDELGPANVITNTTLISINDVTEFVLPTQVRNVIGVIWDNQELGKLSLRELEALDPLWRQKRGKPNSFTDQAETAKTLAFYPTPAVPTGSGSGTGATYPPYSVVTINSEYRADVPVYLELILACLVLEREFIRESDHRDPDFSTLWGQFGDILLSIITGLIVP
jgi:hypothetical protein